MATVIIFNSKGRPVWQSNPVTYTDADKAWFKKPLGK